MNTYGTTGITAITLLGSILTTGAVSSIMMQNTDTISSNILHMVSDVTDDVTTYLKIGDSIGKYDTHNETRTVECIALCVKQYMENTINLSELTIQLCSHDDIVLLSYSGHAEPSNSRGLFENPVWETTNNAFSVIIIADKDQSVLNYNIMNDDTIFLAIRLPPHCAMGNDDTLTVSLLPNKGITSSVVLETPSFHLSNIINFGEL